MSKRELPFAWAKLPRPSKSLENTNANSEDIAEIADKLTDASNADKTIMALEQALKKRNEEINSLKIELESYKKKNEIERLNIKYIKSIAIMAIMQLRGIAAEDDCYPLSTYDDVLKEIRKVQP